VRRLNLLIVAAAMFTLLLSPLMVEAQRGRGGGADQPPAGPTPRLADGKPDLSGLWAEPYTPNMAGRGSSSVVHPETREPLVWDRMGEELPDGIDPNRTFDLPYTELGLQRWKEYDPVSNGDYAGSCMPFGMARNINSPHGSFMVHNENFLAILFEQNTWFHLIPIGDSIVWPDDLPPAWNGYSSSEWDGDTLVVHTKNFNGYTKLDTNGHPHSSSVEMINTFRRVDERNIEHTFTVHDPVMYTEDWMNVRTWRLRDAPDVLMEYSCEENNLGLFDGAITPWRVPDTVD
jgi:hypothetical protein